MKLNNTQINALANNFYTLFTNKEKELDEKHNKLQYNKYKPLYIKGKNLLSKNKWLANISIILPKGRTIILNNNHTFEEFCENWQIRQSIEERKNKKHYSKEDIKNAIILATIDSKDIEELKEKIISMYK